MWKTYICKPFKCIKDRYYNYSLNLQINIIIGLITLVAIIFIISIYYIRTLNYAEKTFIDNGNIMLQETVDKVNSRLKLVENTVYMLSTDSRIQDYKKVTENDINSYLNNCIYFNNYEIHQNGISSVNNLIDDIIFVTDKNTFIAKRLHFTVYNIHKQLENQWFKQAFNNKETLVWTSCSYNESTESILKINEGELIAKLNQFMLILYVQNYKTFENIGYVAASVNSENMCKLIDNIKFGEKGCLYIIDDKGKIIASKDRNKLLKNIHFDSYSVNQILKNNNNQAHFKGKIDKDSYFIFDAPLSINNWKLIITIPVTEVHSSTKVVLLSIIIIGIMCFLVIIAISTLILKNLSLPLKKVLKSIEETRKGNFTQKLDIKGCFEVNQLSTEFNFMLDKINNLLNQIVDKQKAVNKSELKALRAQINPHFLYNTLDSIKWLTISSDTEKASELTTALSTFFRIGLSGGNEEVSIRDEVEHIRQYLFIQKLRCGERLDYVIDVDSNIENMKTLKLILQPIVENAIYHGLDKSETGGFIKVLIKKINNTTIVYEIFDNGKGMSPQALELLTKKIQDPLIENTADHHGYAIRNVNQRIKLSYGDEYGIVYKSKYEIGTKVIVSIPLIQ
ncbi:sensor histidine kinase [Clostridium sp. DJ247]|uniref:sensor histidine kinase n=1 Tax=Clostridium sp. DJ247 TaxID=2726188 RepID=UPI00162A771D|nr:sensor histidine kinase [Clostridium sp. DJ247]MBC2579499.1 sensor histidine kinase [Clostridium sp. DJ247]